jgi:signal transduction histidine kinase
MSLRLKLVFALILAALLPMAVVVGVPLLRAGKEAQAETVLRLERAHRQAEILIRRHERDATAAIEQAASDLRDDPQGRQALLQGPEDVARTIPRVLAERHDLDHVEILKADGMILAASGADATSGVTSAFTDVAPEGGLWRPLGTSLAYFARRTLELDRESFALVGGRVLGAELAAAIAEITGEPTALVDGAGDLAASAGDPGASTERTAVDVPLGDTGWSFRISVPAGDARHVRRELWVAFAGVAPLALVSALVVGALLAHGISRPIRALADRAEQISAERTGPLRLLPDHDDVRRLTVAFDGMLDDLSSSERQRVAAERIAAWQEVARRIAHEVRNPLSPIQLAVENLRRARERTPQEFDHALAEETAAILEAVESLRRLVDEFSQFARLPRPQPVRCNLRQVAAQALALYATRIEAAGIAVELPDADTPEWVVADPEQIGRVLKNVIANALDALEPVVERRLSVVIERAQGPRGAVAQIEVRDSGVGFEPEALRKVFEPYFTTRGDRGGSGLGMAIAHRIVTEHSGTIHASGSPGRGARITIRLPAS